jgi:hypothetical protein
MPDEGYFTIYNLVAGERTISWQILDATTALESVGVHVHKFDTLETDANYHWYSCNCGESSEKVKHSGGTADANGKAKCEVCEAEYEVVVLEGVEFLNVSKKVIADGSTVTKGSATITCMGTGTRSTTTIGLKQTTTTEFLKVTFTALQDCLDRNSLQKATGLWFGLRRTEAQITTDGLIANTWSLGPCYNSNDLYAYYGSSVKYFHSAGNKKEMPNWYWSAGNLSKGDTCYWMVGVTSAGEIKLALVNETVNKVLLKGTIGAENATGLAENGYFTIHSYANAERTLSWEIMSETAALALLG